MSISPVVKGVDEIKELTLKFGNAASATTKPPLLFNQNSEQAFIDKSLQWDFKEYFVMIHHCDLILKR